MEPYGSATTWHLQCEIHAMYQVPSLLQRKVDVALVTSPGGAQRPSSELHDSSV